MMPVVHGLEAAYSEQIDFVYLAIDDAATQPLKAALGYRLQPHFILVDVQGHIVQQWLGLVSESDFREGFQTVVP